MLLLLCAACLKPKQRLYLRSSHVYTLVQWLHRFIWSVQLLLLHLLLLRISQLTILIDKGWGILLVICGILLFLGWFGLLFGKGIESGYIREDCLSIWRMSSVPKLLFIHGFNKTGDGFPELFDPLFDLEGVLLKLFLKGEFNAIDISLDTGVDFILNILINKGVISSIKKRLLLFHFETVNKYFILDFLLEIIEIFTSFPKLVLVIVIKQHWRR